MSVGQRTLGAGFCHRSCQCLQAPNHAPMTKLLDIVIRQSTATPHPHQPSPHPGEPSQGPTGRCNAKNNVHTLKNRAASPGRAKPWSSLVTDPPNLRMRAFLKCSGKAIGDHFNAILPTSHPLSSQPPALSQDSSSSHPGDNYSDRLAVKGGSVAWKALEAALRLLERSADACPPLKSTMGGLVACLDLTHVSYCV